MGRIDDSVSGFRPRRAVADAYSELYVAEVRVVSVS